MLEQRGCEIEVVVITLLLLLESREEPQNLAYVGISTWCALLQNLNSFERFLTKYLQILVMNVMKGDCVEMGVS